jgi:hypothetical protein
MKKIIGITGAVAALIVIGLFAKSGGFIGSSNEPVNVPLTAEEQQEVAEQKAAISPATQSGRYTHPGIGFSFDKPAGYTVGVVTDADGSQTLIVQPLGGDVRKAFQIFISPIEEAVELTPSLIKAELADVSVLNAQKIVLDSRGKGMMFESNNDAFGGKSYEIWFSTDTHLYQVTSYREFASELRSIIGTWKFN